MRPRRAAVEIAPTTEAAARILDRAPGAGLLVLDARGRVVHAGAGGAAVAGRGRDDLLGRSFGDLVDAADREAAQRVLGSPGDESTPPARAVVRLSPPPGGQPRRAVVACWRTSVDGMDGPLVCVLRRTADGERPDGRLDRLYICELTHGARVLEHFAAWGTEQQLGPVPDGLTVADAWEACVAFSDRGVYGEAWARTAAGQPVTCTYRLTGYDGETRWILDRSWPVVIPGGRQLLYGIVTDVTDHVTPRLTAADDSQIALTVRALGDMVFATDALPGRRAETSYASRPPEAFYGLQVEPGESSAETLITAIVPADRGAYERVQQAATAGRAAEAVVGVRGHDGTVRQFWFRSVPVAAPDGGARAVGVVSDVTGILGDRSPAPLAPPAGIGLPVREPTGEPPPALTPRQREILRLLAEGCSNEEIAQALSLSRTTVRNHTSGLYARLGVRSRLEAVAVARRLGIVS